MLPDVNRKKTPTLSQTVVPKGIATEGLEATPSSTHTVLPFPLSNTVGLSIDSTLTTPTTLSILAPVFSPLAPTINPIFSPLTPTKRRASPPPIPYDPDTIFGGDSDVDPYDYDDEDEDDSDSCFGYDRSIPCPPRPLSQGQPTAEGLRAWLEERGLWAEQTNHYLTTKAQITLISEVDVDITPSYPYFTPFNLAALGPASPGASPPSPLNTLALPLPLPDDGWDSSGVSSCEATGTEVAECSCETSSDITVVNLISAPPDHSVRRDNDLLPDEHLADLLTYPFETE